MQKKSINIAKAAKVITKLLPKGYGVEVSNCPRSGHNIMAFEIDTMDSQPIEAGADVDEVAKHINQVMGVDDE